MNELKNTASRRDILKCGGAFGAFLLILGSAGGANAQGVHGFRDRIKRYKQYKRENPEPEQSWLDGILPNTKKAIDPASTPHPGIFKTAKACTEIGAKARLYCIKTIKGGDQTLAPCLRSIEAMIPVSNALGKLAELDAARLREMAKFSIRFLDDCERQCSKPAASHPALQGCADSCKRCKGEIRTLLSA